MASTTIASTIVRSAILKTTAAARPAPSLFTYPGLRSQPFWRVDDLPDGALIRAMFADRAQLLAEYRTLASASAAGDYALTPGETKLHKGTWTWHSALVKGAFVPTFALAAPTTAAHLQRMPGLLTGVPFSYAFFSSLASGAAISPHHGPANLRLRVHIPLSIPEGDCGIRVAGEARAWDCEGGPLVFDDSYEHETWNRCSVERVVLLFDVWHPDLSMAEREAVCAMFREARRSGWLS